MSAAAAKRLSPGASLLRKSRLMAMPAPVPSPPSYFLNSPGVSPHPTVQAITTPSSSHSRGNWGLKRDLPTKTKYPFLRYTSLDTLEHFMEYESAADDVLTVKKWQEMDVPIFKGPVVDHNYSHPYTLKETVFEHDETGAESYKWRYEGPYLPDMPAGEFKRYIETKIKPRRAEFLEFVAKHQHRYRKTEYDSTAPRNYAQYTQPPPKPTTTEASTNTEGEIRPEDVDILALRADTSLLGVLVLEFLDIPFYSRPHRTHPSGGLHYKRSSAAMRNDPVEGPRQAPRPVRARLMNHHSSSGALVGIGGIVARAADAGRLDETIKVHNNRTIVRPYAPGKARMDALGRVLLDVDSVGADGGQGNYGGFREGGNTAELLKGMVGGSRAYGGLYDGMETPRAQGQPQGNSKQMDDVMDLLDSFR